MTSTPSPIIRDYPRTFVAADADLGEWPQIEPHFERLAERPLETIADVRQWLDDWSELDAGIAEAEAERYVAMTCQTDDAEREKRYLAFVEEVTPRCKPWWHRLRTRYTSCSIAADLPRPRYAVLDRSIRNQVALFREENVPLETEDEKLRQRYDKMIGAMTVAFDGQDRTLPQMARYQEEPDRALRHRAWEATTNRRLQDAEELDSLFDTMIQLRTKIARNAGFADYLEYVFKEKERFDYTPADCENFHVSIERHAVPQLRELQARRKAKLGVDALRPWDLAVDPQSRPALKPFSTGEELYQGCSRIFHRINAELGEQFDRLHAANMLDLESRKGKAPGGYQYSFEERRIPFIFMNAVGLHRDVETLIHEGGHAFHSFASRDEPLHAYRHAPMEFCEVASMGMELLAIPHLDEFYPDAADLRRARRKQFEGIVEVLPWIATIDAFQHWIYTHPGHTHDERRQAWQAVFERFSGDVDYAGQERARAYRWQAQLHLYRVPFYYVEYGIAQLGALSVWSNARRDTAKAIADYRSALALGGSRPLPELFAGANIRFDFSDETVKPLMDAVAEQLAELDD